MDSYSFDEVNEKLDTLINEARTIWDLYDKLKKYEILNKNNLYDKTLVNLKYEVMLENDLYNSIDLGDRTILTEYLNNYKYDSIDNDNILDNDLNISMKDAIVERIKTRIANSIISDGLEEYNNLKYESNNKESQEIIENCSRNYYNNASDISKYSLINSLVNEYNRNYFNILCSQIDKTTNSKIKKKLIVHKYNTLFYDNILEKNILLSDNSLLNFFLLDSDFLINDCEELKEMLDENRNDFINKNFEIDIQKMIKLSDENTNTISFETKRILLYTSIRSNISLLTTCPAKVLIAEYAREVKNIEKIKNKNKMLEILLFINENLKYDSRNIDSIRVRKLQKN